MDLRFAEPLDLGQLAAHAGFSKFHFARTFKDAYGETPATYLTRRRVERAKDLLRSANLTVTEVCMLVGFSSLGSFSSRFSELVGMSPRAFQRMSAARGGPPPVPGCFVMDWARPRPVAKAAPTGARRERVGRSAIQEKPEPARSPYPEPDGPEHRYPQQIHRRETGTR
jgi:AraC-like DNA-binding protein